MHSSIVDTSLRKTSEPCGECRRRRSPCANHNGDVEDVNKSLKWLPPGQVLSKGSRSKKSGSLDGKWDVALIHAAKLEASETKLLEVAPYSMDAGPLISRRMRSDICDVAEASMYYNANVLPYEFSGQIDSNYTTLPMTPLRLPEASQHLLVVMMLYHRSRMVPGFFQPNSVGSLRAYHFTKLAIEDLNRRLSVEMTRASDDTFYSIHTFATTELMNSINPRWEMHYKAMLTIIDLRGGFANFMRTTTYPKEQTFSFLIWAITNAATTHSSQLSPMFCQSETIDWLYHLNTGTDSGFPCPLPLLVNIVEINILRRQRNKYSRGNIPGSWKSAVQELLTRIRDFPLNDWIDSKRELRKEWSLIIKTYHAAIALFALGALGAVTDSKSQPTVVWAQAFRLGQRKHLASLLGRAWKMPTLKFNLLWPAMIAGFEAAKGNAREKIFVDQYLEQMASEMAVASPLHGRMVLKRFWKLPNGQWDDCFDGAYCFTL